jgi:hypothetical protein
MSRDILKICTYCGGESEEAAAVCARCGEEFGVADSIGEVSVVPIYRDPVARFRMLVAVSTICYMLTLIGPWIFWRNVSEQTHDVLSWSGFDAVLLIPPTIVYMTAAVWVLAAVGVYFFVPAALWLYTALVIYSIATTLLRGVTTGLAVESFLIYLSSLADGAILALAYWTPLRDKFKQPAGEPSSEDERR